MNKLEENDEQIAEILERIKTDEVYKTEQTKKI